MTKKIQIKKELPAVVKKEKTALVPKHSNNKKNNF